MSAYPVKLKIISAVAAATGSLSVFHLPFRIETRFQRERGISVREIRACLSWGAGRKRRGFEWALYLTGKTLPPAAALPEIAHPPTGREA